MATQPLHAVMRYSHFAHFLHPPLLKSLRCGDAVDQTGRSFHHPLSLHYRGTHTELQLMFILVFSVNHLLFDSYVSPLLLSVFILIVICLSQ